MSAPWDSPNHAICPECGFTASDKEKPNSGWFECQCGAAFDVKIKPKEPSWASLEGLKQAVNDLISANDRLFGEVDRLRSERDMYWEVYLAAKDVRDLREQAVCCPVTKEMQDKAALSLEFTIDQAEDWENNL